jgi:hypothetical protein
METVRCGDGQGKPEVFLRRKRIAQVFCIATNFVEMKENVGGQG